MQKYRINDSIEEVISENFLKIIMQISGKTNYKMRLICRQSLSFIIARYKIFCDTHYFSMRYLTADSFYGYG